MEELLGYVRMNDHSDRVEEDYCSTPPPLLMMIISI